MRDAAKLRFGLLLTFSLLLALSIRVVAQQIPEEMALSQTQRHLIETINAKKEYESHRRPVRKRGYMKLVTELSRTDLAASARKNALARMTLEGGNS